MPGGWGLKTQLKVEKPDRIALGETLVTPGNWGLKNLVEDWKTRLRVEKVGGIALGETATMPYI